LKEFFDPYLPKLYDKDTKIALTYDKEPARYDLPYGAADVFGCGALLAELLYGIFEQIESGGNWTHLLFPMSDPDAKKEILDAISGDESALRELMMDRAEYKDDFEPVMEMAFKMGVGDLILKCLETDPNKRILVEAAIDHPFWTAPI